MSYFRVMDDPVEKLQKFFSLPPEEKSLHLQEMISLIVSFMEQAKDTLQRGSLQEKAKILSQIAQIQAHVAEEIKTASEKSGLSEEEMQRMMENPALFPAQDQKFLQEAKEKIQQQAKEIGNILQGGTPSPPHHPHEKKGPPDRNSGWIKP